jgi:pSer/pThr/pTyr-binding forkhead associated (FHA) protein
VQSAPPSGTGFSLVLVDSGIRLPLEMGKDLLVGRSDEKRNIFPDIDLDKHGGFDAGVSRRHAMLSLHHKSCVVKDLGSANGTFINSRRIPPNQPTLINHGDELRFGTLSLQVESHS